MSGGSYGYFYLKIEEYANEINVTTPERAAFRALVRLVANAAHDIEWVDSCDYGKGQEREAIMKCVTEGAVLGVTIEKAIQARNELEAALTRAGQ